MLEVISGLFVFFVLFAPVIVFERELNTMFSINAATVAIVAWVMLWTVPGILFQKGIVESGTVARAWVCAALLGLSALYFKRRKLRKQK